MYPGLRDFLTIGPALAGISLGRNPNGAVNEIVRSIRDARTDRPAAASEAAVDRRGPDAVDGVTRADAARLDIELGLADEPGYARLAAVGGRRRHGVV